jgi:hypothetical protein
MTYLLQHQTLGPNCCAEGSALAFPSTTAAAKVKAPTTASSLALPHPGASPAPVPTTPVPTYPCCTAQKPTAAPASCQAQPISPIPTSSQHC